MSRTTRAHILLMLCAAIWGFSFVAQVAGASVGAFTFNATRFAIGGVSLLPLVAVLDARAGRPASARRDAWRSVVGPGLICGALLFGGSSLQQLGIESTTAGNAAFVTGLYVALVPAVGVLVGRRTNRTTWLGVLLAVAGLWLLTVTPGRVGINPGDLLCLAGTAFWTAHILAIGHFARRTDVLRLSVAQFLANAGYAAAAAVMLERAPFASLSGAVGPVLYAGLVAVGVAYTLQVVGQQDAKESHAAMIMSLETVFGALGGALLLGEQMGPRALLGCALILAGILLSQVPARGESPAVPVPVPEPPSTALRAD